MTDAFERIDGAGRAKCLIVVDHASNRVPPDIALGIEPELLDRHIGWDIGAAVLGRALQQRLGCAALFGNVSRLVLDLHREPDSPGLIPEASDGHVVPGNAGLTAAARKARLDRFWRPYHEELARLVASLRPELILALHSFTPQLETAVGAPRPWQVGILYNQDDRASRIAIPWLRAAGLMTGDNEPYSGRRLNATMNMHAEANGIPYLAIEVRNDLLRNPVSIERWSATLESLALHCRNELARGASSKT